MKIVNCPKGGRVPEGYCQDSCLNYPGVAKKEKWSFLRKLRNLFLGKRRPWIQFYKEEVRCR